MIDTRAVTRSLPPLVASILGRKYGVQVEMGGADAYTDGSVIHLPALPGDVPDTLLALARGYVDHEAAHIRDRDSGLEAGWPFAPRNACLEHPPRLWVEHKLASIFPGCRQNFDWLIRHIFGSESSGVAAQPAMQILNRLLLAEVRSWDVQALATNRNILAEQVDNIFPGLRLKVGLVLALSSLNAARLPTP